MGLPQALTIVAHLASHDLRRTSPRFFRPHPRTATNSIDVPPCCRLPSPTSFRRSLRWNSTRPTLSFYVGLRIGRPCFLTGRQEIISWEMGIRATTSSPRRLCGFSTRFCKALYFIDLLRPSSFGWALKRLCSFPSVSACADSHPSLHSFLPLCLTPFFSISAHLIRVSLARFCIDLDSFRLVPPRELRLYRGCSSWPFRVTLRF